MTTASAVAATRQDPAFRKETAMGLITGIDHPAIAVSDVTTVSAWYCRVLGYAVHSRDDTKPVQLLQAPDGTFLEVMPQLAQPRPARECCTPGHSHLALRVSDFDQAVAWLTGQGVVWMGDEVKAMGGGRLRSFADPDGNMLQIVQR